MNRNSSAKASRVKVVYEDAAGDPKQAIAAYEKLIANPDVVVILGPTLSSEAKSADPLAQEARVPVIASSNTVGGHYRNRRLHLPHQPARKRRDPEHHQSDQSRARI